SIATIKKVHERKIRFVSIVSMIPEVLVLVTIMLIISYAVDFTKYDIRILGSFDNKIQPPTPPPFNGDQMQRLLFPSIMITIVGFIESQTVTKAMGLKNNYFPSGDRELFAFGASNVMGSLLGAYVTFGSLPRSRILATAGGKTMMCGLMAAVIVLVCVLVLEPVLRYLPRPTLASIVFVAAYNLIEWGEILFVFRLRAWTEILMFLGCWIITLVLSIEDGILLSLVLAGLIIVRRTTNVDMCLYGTHSGIGSGSDTSSTHHTHPSPTTTASPPVPAGKLCDPINPATVKYVDLREHPDAELCPGVIVVGVQAPLLFYNAGKMRRTLETLMKAERKYLLAEKRKKEGKGGHGHGNVERNQDTVTSLNFNNWFGWNQDTVNSMRQLNPTSDDEISPSPLTPTNPSHPTHHHHNSKNNAKPKDLEYLSTTNTTTTTTTKPSLGNTQSTTTLAGTTTTTTMTTATSDSATNTPHVHLFSALSTSSSSTNRRGSEVSIHIDDACSPSGEDDNEDEEDAEEGSGSECGSGGDGGDGGRPKYAEAGTQTEPKKKWLQGMGVRMGSRKKRVERRVTVLIDLKNSVDI
ncbi:Solute carrier 26, partial [Quaeritorhiza haematococci]